MAGSTPVAMLSDLQKLTVQAIVNLFETGSVRGKYGQVTLLPNDSGHLTYGRSQTTLASGNLHLLIKAYCEESKAAFAADFARYTDALSRRDLGLDNDLPFRNLLRRAGDDPVMHSVQDRFFDRVYWAPALIYAARCKIASPLGTSVVYDSIVHGSWGEVRDLTTEQFGSPDTLGERQWVEKYVTRRREWLASRPNALLHRTVYRMDAFAGLIQQDKWTLGLPIVVLARRIDEAALLAPALVRVSADGIQVRTLQLQKPLMRGDDVVNVQTALARKGFSCPSNGVYDEKTEAAVKDFQRQHELKIDGIVGPAARAVLNV